jgi:acetylornithine deacetylase/succinyl-diaminopimelate desuccinylase-like protein
MNQSDLESLLESHVRVLCKTERNTGNCPVGLERAEKYLRGAFQGLGYEVTRQEFRADGVPSANIEALPPGFVGFDRPHIIIGAHYDSAPGTPGADDNASAVAILLEVARLLAGKPCAKSLRFVAYTNEEPPHFCTPTMGSVVHAKHCRKRGDKIAGMICLESLGVFTNEPGSQSLAILGFLSIPAELDHLCRLSGIDPTIGNFVRFGIPP